MARTSDYDKFLAEVLEEVPADLKGSLEETLRNDKVAGAVKSRVLARSDYSRQSDQLKQEREAFQAEVQEARTRIDGWTNWWNDAAKAEAARQKELKAYKDTFGELDGSGPRKDLLSREEFDKAMADTLRERDANAIRFADLLTDLKIEHRQEFGVKLDTDALIAFATKQGLPLQSAYERMTSDARKEKQDKDFEARLAKAKEEGAREALSNHKLPMQSGPIEPHVLDLQGKDLPRTKADRVAAAIADWNSADTHSQF